MVQARVILSRVLYWGGLATILAGIWLVLDGASGSGRFGPPRVWIGFAVGLAGMALTARGATLRRF